MPLSFRLLPAPVLASLAGLCPAAPAPAAAEISVPSGEAVAFMEVIHDAPGPEGRAARFRFVAPGVGALDPDAVDADMLQLCEAYALPRLSPIGPQPRQVIVSLADRPVAFGDPDPDVVQFIGAFRPEGGRCIPEAF